MHFSARRHRGFSFDWIIEWMRLKEAKRNGRFGSNEISV